MLPGCKSDCEKGDSSTIYRKLEWTRHCSHPPRVDDNPSLREHRVTYLLLRSGIRGEEPAAVLLVAWLQPPVVG